MKHRTHRLRRVAAAIALGVGGVGGVIGLAAGTAGAAVHAKISATSAPSVGASGTTIGAGSLKITFPSTTTLAAKVIKLKVKASGGGTVTWAAAPTITHTSGSISTEAIAANVLTFKVSKAAGTTDDLGISGVKYDLTAAHGTIEVSPTGTTGVPIVRFTTTFVVNAKAPGASLTVPTTKTIAATSTPSIGRATGQTAGNWTVTFTASTTATKAVEEGWAKTVSFTVSVNYHTAVAKNCTGTKYVLLTSTPTATVSGTTKVSAKPTVSVSTAAAAPCSAADHNEVKVTFTNTGKFTAKNGTFTVTLSGVKYQVGATTPATTVGVTAKYTGTGFGVANTQTAAPHESNARIATVFVKANTPAVTVPSAGFDAAISPIEVVETAASSVKSGLVCISLSGTNFFNTRATAKGSVVTGTGTVTSTVTYQTGAGAKATTLATAVFAVLHVKHSSITKATTYEVSGLRVNATTTAGGVKATVKHATATKCTTTTKTLGTATAFTIGTTTNVIFGATADATAAKQLETRYPTTTKTTGATKTQCIGTTVKTTGNAVRSVILATTKTFQDALSSSYLAGYLKTGTLLTPTLSLSAVTKQALRTEGIDEVYVVGGPLAVTTTVVSTLETTPAYTCGGAAPLKTGKTTVFLHVTRIFGQTQYDTAKAIAETVPSNKVKTAAFAGAYFGVNATKGDGMYNDTAGTASVAPTTAIAVKTAILSSGVEFQDAMAASALAYGTSVPVLLTTPTALSQQASAAIETLGIKQVILMGGPLAVTNTVVTSLQDLGVSVLRIGGKNYTDTAVQLAKFEENTLNSTGRGWNGTTATFTGHLHKVVVARGNGFTDGLAGAVITGHTHLPLLLTLNPTTVGTSLTAFLKASGTTGKGVNTRATSKLNTLEIFGGPLAVTPAVINTMEGDIS